MLTPADGDDIIVPLDVDDGVPANSAVGVSLVLVCKLSLLMRAGEHLIATGNNGIRKTAVARVIVEL